MRCADMLMPIQLYGRRLKGCFQPAIDHGALNRRGSMFGADLQTIASAALVAGVAISKRVPTFVLKRRGHSCQKSETTRNDRAFIA